MNLYGLKIQAMPDRPKYILPLDVPPPKGMTREEFNAWSLDVCGHYNPISDGEVIQMFGVLYVNPRTYEQIKAGTEVFTPKSHL